MSVPTRAAAWPLVCSRPCRLPNQRDGTDCTKNPCFAGYDQATASPSTTFTTRKRTRLWVIPYVIQANAETVYPENMRTQRLYLSARYPPSQASSMGTLTALHVSPTNLTDAPRWRSHRLHRTSKTPIAKLPVMATTRKARTGFVTSARYGGCLTLTTRRRRACSGSRTASMRAIAGKAESTLPNRKIA